MDWHSLRHVSTQGWRGKYGKRYARAFGRDLQTAVSVIQHRAWMENVSTTIISKRQQLRPLSAEKWISPYFQAQTRQMIFSAVLTDYIRATVKSSGSCHWCYFFKILTQAKDLKCFCNTITDVHWSETMISDDMKWWQLTDVMQQQLTFEVKTCIVLQIAISLTGLS